jgi:Amidohydrolase family
VATSPSPKARSLYQRFAKNHTWQTPTLVLVRALCSLDDPRFTTDPRVKYMPAFVRSYWDLKSLQNQALMKSMAGRKQSYNRSLEEVAKMHRAGVEILAGTDTPFPFCFPGFGLHDELALLVQAGITPMEALQSATRYPARYLGRILDLGTVEKGKLADLVLLDANPLDEIRNTKRIAAVIVRGKLLSQETLRKMLADRERAPSPNR